MADEQSSELVRELRRIRLLLSGILAFLVLSFSLNLALDGYHRWAETHYRVSARSQEFRDSHGELRAIHNELSNQRDPPPVEIPGGEVAARAGNQSE
jgi:hypothetical protein